MIRFLAIITTLTLLSACARSQGVGFPQNQAYQPFPGQGQYVRPEYLNPAPTPLIPAQDACRSQLYAGLVGRHEGAIYIAGLPGRKRVVKPASIEDFDLGRDRIDGIDPDPPFIEVRDFLPEQSLYAPSIRTISDRIQLGPYDESRLTIELDRDGYVQQVDCR